MRILALESSCDESAAAVLDETGGLLAHALYSQVDLHRIYGGVVPELASRDHVRRLLPLVAEVLAASGTQPGELSGIAHTAGPGLIGALLTGGALARSLAYAWGVPAVAVHHLEGHLLAPLLEPDPPPFPHVALLVSGGHTMLVHVHSIGRYEILGETRDDAAGEAFDKSAKLLGLPYPGGPELARLAEQGTAGKFSFPRPMIDRPGLEFSFSGLKTAVAQAVARGAPLDERARADIAAEAQAAIVDTLVAKALRALAVTSLDTLVVSGGVGANRMLRTKLTATAARMGARVFYPRVEFCTDNAAMIAVAGLLRLRHALRAAAGRGVAQPGTPLEPNTAAEPGTSAPAISDLAIPARARWPLDSLDAVAA